ncbi:MAG: hypothetical protein PHG82_05670, partial [Candidatus Gracilibacteria bacterium]|nr:hypothetical protein [Candidatus Gracilibacteria bacterium]
MGSENQTTSLRKLYKAVKLELPADLLGTLEEVKTQAQALTGGNTNWLNETLAKQKTSTNLRYIPEKWMDEPELLKRLDLFLGVIEKNHDWGKRWADKFYIRENTFEFPEVGLNL